MDVRGFLGKTFLKVDDVKAHGSSIRVTIMELSEGNYGKLESTFDDGTVLSLNVTNTRALARAYGTDNDKWVGKEIKLVIGNVDFQGKAQEAIIVETISPPIDQKDRPKPKKNRGDMDDEIPF